MTQNFSETCIKWSLSHSPRVTGHRFDCNKNMTYLANKLFTALAGQFADFMKQHYLFKGNFENTINANNNSKIINGKKLCTFTYLTFFKILITGLFKAEAGREIHLLFSTNDEEGKRYYDEDNQVNVKIRASSGNFVKKKIDDNLDGSYTVSFTPDTVGLHSVIITVNGQPLTGSPWSVQVSPHQYKCVFDIELGDLNAGITIVVNKKTNEIAVAERIYNRVLMFNADHSYSRSLHLELAPFSVAFTTNGELIVVQRGCGFLSLFNESGEFIKPIGDEYLKDPITVSVAHDGRIIVCEWRDKSVKVLSPDGTELLQSFSAPDCVFSPWFAVYHQDMFFVCYGWAHCVKVFSKEGVFQILSDSKRF